MKTPEDEAFDELARRQGMWGGGYQAKRRMAADKVQEPVLDIDGHVVGKMRKPKPAQEPDALTIAYQSGFYDGKKAAQRPWVGLTDEEIRDCLGPEAVRIPLGWSRLTRAIEAKLKEKNT
jgi:hypothetical protein